MSGLKGDRKLGRVLGLVQDSSQTIQTAGARMNKVVTSLRDFSRLDEADVQRVDLATGIESALAMIPQKTKEGVRIDLQLGQGTIITCRPKELNQVFLTLLTGSLEGLGGTGGLSVTLAEESDRVVLEIADDGDGIPPEDLAHLFDVGFETKEGRVGMGLELLAAQNIVQRHRGTLTATSELGRGTTFRLTLPAGAGLGKEPTS